MNPTISFQPGTQVVFDLPVPPTHDWADLNGTLGIVLDTTFCDNSEQVVVRLADSVACDVQLDAGYLRVFHPAKVP
jgi:hypothetical protein